MLESRNIDRWLKALSIIDDITKTSIQKHESHSVPHKTKIIKRKPHPM